jgi:hypothetical protein
MHPRLDGADRRTGGLGDFLDLLSLVVDQVDHFAMNWRQLREAFLQDVASLALLVRGRRRVRGILDDRGNPVIQLCLRAAPALRDRLEPRDRQQPSRDLGASFEFLRVPPSFEEYLVDDLVRRRLVAGQA